MISGNLDEDDDEEITDKDFNIMKVTTEVLSKVVEYCTHYQTVEPMTEIATPLNGLSVEEIVKQDWYVQFCKVEREMLHNLVAAANYLDIKPLLDLTCLAVAVSIKGKSEQELRDIYGIPDPNPSKRNKDSGKDDSGDTKMEEGS